VCPDPGSRAPVTAEPDKGNFNTAVGKDALANNTTASENSAVGAEALQSNTTGDGNTHIQTTAFIAGIRGVTGPWLFTLAPRLTPDFSRTPSRPGNARPIERGHEDTAMTIAERLESDSP
jgi:hypothetical protein